jgi:hypothetical protein
MRDYRARVVHRDQIETTPRRTHRPQVAERAQRTVSWSRHDVGYDPGQVVSAWMGVYRRTGQRPRIAYSKRAVSQRKLKVGDPVACTVDVRGDDAQRRRQDRVTRARPMRQPFGGITHRVRDRHGTRTVHREQPGVLPALMPYYDPRYRLLSKSTGKKSSARKRSRRVRGCTTPEATLRYRTARQVPLVVHQGRGARGHAARGVKVTGRR